MQRCVHEHDTCAVWHVFPNLAVSSSFRVVVMAVAALCVSSNELPKRAASDPPADA